MLYVASIDRFDMVNAIDVPATTIWFAGCDFRCPKCHNPELWDRDAGRLYKIDALLHHIRNTPKDVVLAGGEPFQQPRYDLYMLMHELVHDHGRRVWLYTGYEINCIPEHFQELCYTIKTGRYIQELATPNARLASSNQKFWRWEMENGRLTLKETQL